MTKKIESVIKHCTECRYAKEFDEKNGNADFALVCIHPDDESFLVSRNSSPHRHLDVPIPEQCPLEDYENKN